MPKGVQPLLELWQAWCDSHFPGELLSPLREEPFPDVQPEVALMQQ